MSLTLVLMRHAKSTWDDPTMDDSQRGLNARGRIAAPAIANWLVAKGYLPDTVLVSSARRTVETWERMAAIMPETATMESNPALYLASPDIILNVVKNQTSPVIMLIAHNPGIAEFAERILQAKPDHPKFARHPTAATTIIEFDAPNWDTINWQQGRAIDFVVPSDLDDSPFEKT
ncbi:histidine phosphatase family protein [Rhodobacteraceae bacterium]|nr:histidine phosphatase family protein [Paracoccaceae bacterium]